MKKKGCKSSISTRNKKKNNHKKTKKVNNPDTSKPSELRPKKVKFNIHQLYKKKLTKEELIKARKDTIEKFKNRPKTDDIPESRED